MPASDTLTEFVEICHRLYDKGFVTATDGNVSIRLPGGNLLVTPSGLNKGELTPSGLVEITPEGVPVTPGKKVSSEVQLHLFIYRQRSDIRAVVHAHPTYATGFAAARKPLSAPVLPEVILQFGAIPLAPYATPSTSEVPDSLAPFIHRSTAILLANHGVVTYAKSLRDAYYKMEKVEHYARISFVARQLGGPVPLTADELYRLQAAARDAFGIEIDPDSLLR